MCHPSPSQDPFWKKWSPSQGGPCHPTSSKVTSTKPSLHRPHHSAIQCERSPSVKGHRRQGLDCQLLSLPATDSYHSLLTHFSTQGTARHSHALILPLKEGTVPTAMCTAGTPLHSLGAFHHHPMPHVSLPALPAPEVLRFWSQPMWGEQKVLRGCNGRWASNCSGSSKATCWVNE